MDPRTTPAPPLHWNIDFRGGGIALTVDGCPQPVVATPANARRVAGLLTALAEAHAAGAFNPRSCGIPVPSIRVAEAYELAGELFLAACLAASDAVLEAECGGLEVRLPLPEGPAAVARIAGA